MKAMIFAAGLGTRLKPLTDTMPKALIPVAGKPLLWHTIQKLKAAGFDEIIINVHHFAGQIRQYIQDNNRFGIRIEFSDETQALLDTGGGIKKASWFFDDEKPFLIHNVDILSDIDLQNLYHFHTDSNSVATLVVSERKTSRYLLFDKNNHLAGWINEKSGEIKTPFSDFHNDTCKKLAFSGIHILHPSILGYMRDFPDKFSIIDFYLFVCKIHSITCYAPANMKMMDVRKIDSLKEADKFFEK